MALGPAKCHLAHACVSASLHTTHLDGELGAHALDAVHKVHALVNADDVGAAGSHALQQATAAADVQDDGQVGVGLLHAADDLLDVGAGEDVEVLGGQVAGPGVKDLH